MRIVPEAYDWTVEAVEGLIGDEWGWLTQRWGQETIDEPIRRILTRTENGLRHLPDLLVARAATPACSHCHLPHGDLVCHIDVKSAHNDTGKVLVEIRSWMALRDETRAFIPAVFVVSPAAELPVAQWRWIPASHLNGDDMFVGPRTGRGSGDPYFMLFWGMADPIATLRCWDGWS